MLCIRDMCRSCTTFSLRYTKSACDAEEIVHDVFVRLWNIRGHIKSTESLRPLLFVMAKHYLINAFRSNVNFVYMRII